MIIYIHGFGGSGEGTKATILKELLSTHDGMIAPSLPSNPQLAINTLKELIESFLKTDNVYLIGSSLGGYYALHLSSLYNIPAVLINPSVTPYETLKRSLGYAPNFYDGSTYEWNEKHLAILKHLEVKEFFPNKLLVLLQKGDELLNYNDALTKLNGAKFIVEDGGNNSFDGIERHIDTMVDFFATYDIALIPIFAKISDTQVQEFLKSIDKSDLICAMQALPDGIIQRIFDNISQKAKEGILDELRFASKKAQDINDAIQRLNTLACNMFNYDSKTNLLKPYAKDATTLSAIEIAALSAVVDD